jgi:hypothetical protein
LIMNGRWVGVGGNGSNSLTGPVWLSWPVLGFVRPFVRSELLIESNRISRGLFCTNFGQNSRFFLDKLGANFGWVLFVATVEWSGVEW